MLNAHPLVRHLLVPAYLYSGWSLWESLRTSKQLGLFVAAALLCTLATLVPAMLVEFRWQTLPMWCTVEGAQMLCSLEFSCARPGFWCGTHGTGRAGLSQTCGLAACMSLLTMAWLRGAGVELSSLCCLQSCIDHGSRFGMKQAGGWLTAEQCLAVLRVWE